jgi:hypothetical protein
LADWDVQAEICGEQVALAIRSAVRCVDCDVQTVFLGEQLPFVWSLSFPMGGLRCSDSVLW